MGVENSLLVSSSHVHAEFLDNYTFSLQLQTEINGAEETNSQPPQSQSTPEAPASSFRREAPAFSSRCEAPASSSRRGNSKGKRKSAFEFIESALSIAESIVTIATAGDS
ncbi:hypothetical protein O6P43_003141 [Quillaja saponaria]|uniref:Uncharacterized protein n=1 Tax=Quillaja saponaria TaxID=32244 RepID=A0AAD7VLG2_QUISA|nr:hypothetical protein O6P43_003141 [Quillaja saponaria]